MKKLVLLFLSLPMVILLLVWIFQFESSKKALRCNELQVSSSNIGNSLNEIFFATFHRKRMLTNGPFVKEPVNLPFLGDLLSYAEKYHLHSLNNEPKLKSLDMLHESCPGLVLKLRSSLRSAFWYHLPQPRLDGCTVIYIRCGDVPNTMDINYTLLNFSWYCQALALVPSQLRQTVKLRCCFQHPQRTELSPVCYPYVQELLQHLQNEGYTCFFDCACNDANQDFLSLCSADALIVGGCSGSFGFWAAVLGEGYAVIPSVKAFNHCELGHSYMQKFDSKYILHAERVPYQPRSEDMILLCKQMQPSEAAFRGRVMYINRDQDFSRRQHMEEEITRLGLQPHRKPPITDDDAERSLLKTHRALLEAIASDNEWVMVCEDDVSLQAEHWSELQHEVEALMENFKMIIYLGLCLKNSDLKGSITFRGLCAHAYLVSPSAAAYLVWLIDSNNYIEKKSPIDMVLYRHVSAPLLRPNLFSPNEKLHIGVAYQDRKAPWYNQVLQY